MAYLEIPMFPQTSSLNSATSLALATILALGLTACGGKSEPAPAAAVPPAEQTAPDAAAEGIATTEGEAAALAAREQELADQEAELALREREAELARREAELAAREAAVKAPAKATTPPKTAATPKPAASAPAAAAVAPAPPPPPVTVPTGTQFTVELTSPLSTKTSLADDPVEARLASDLMVGDRRVASAGSLVRGSVQEVTSGSKKIGAVPALRIDFNQLVVADGSTVAINARAVRKGQSEKGRDTAKIAGGAAAGAIIGHQIDDDKGKVIGGLLGGAAGAIGAQKTGTEVELPAGSTLTATTRADFEYKGR
jgi:Tfp pilus assembly protein PilX